MKMCNFAAVTKNHTQRIMIKLKDGFSGERALVLPQMIVKMMEDDPLGSVLHITDIGYYPKAMHHYRERKEPIDQYVLIYCVDGAGRYSVGGHDYTVEANQYFILPANMPHRYESDSENPWTIYWIHFKGTHAPYYAAGATRPMDIRPQAHSRISDRLNIFEEIFNTLKDGFSMGNLIYSTSLFHYFLGSLRYLQQYRKANANAVDEENIIDVAIHYMKENIEKHVSLQSLSDYIGFSPSHFSAMFKRKTGHAPLTYFNLLRIRQACFMLDTTDMKVNQISYKIGIDDTYYFSRLFSKIMGMSPRAYRNASKG